MSDLDTLTVLLCDPGKLAPWLDAEGLAARGESRDGGGVSLRRAGGVW